MDTPVSSLTRLTQRAHAYFADHVGVGFDAMAAPIDSTLPAGSSLRGSSVYGTIEKARRQDDASLPMGAWEHDLKRADWEKVSAVTVDALRHRSKDLQLLAWLLEAQINKNGLIAVAPCLLLLHTLCECYWSDLHPLPENDDYDFRANILRWMNEKLLPVLRLAPLAAAEREGYYCWADWERARRDEQIRPAMGKPEADNPDSVAPARLAAALTATDSRAVASLYESMVDALDAIALMTATIDRCFGADGPSLGKMAGLLQQILALMNAELNKRGIYPNAQATHNKARNDEDALPQPPADNHATAHPVMHDDMEGEMNAQRPASGGPIRDRVDAYVRLAEAADYLIRMEPHSPAPYLVNRAIEWGRMNTGDLYQELFLRLNGQLNIFEMLGLQLPQGQDDRA